MNLSDFPSLRCDGLVLHWTAGRWDKGFPDYNICILGPPRDGEVVITQPLANNLRQIRSGPYAAHTLRRNSFRLGLAVCAGYGRLTGRIADDSYEFLDFPPTPRQLEAIAAVAGLGLRKWQQLQSSQVERFLRTHWEWAEQDGYGAPRFVRWDFKREGPLLKRKALWYARNA